MIDLLWWYEQNIYCFSYFCGVDYGKGWGLGNFWSYIEAFLKLNILYIPLVLDCFSLKSAKFYYACCFIHCIRIMCWLLNIDFYIVLNVSMLLLGSSLHEVFPFDCIALRYVLYLNFKKVSW